MKTASSLLTPRAKRVAEKGKRIYDEIEKECLKPEQKGMYVAIEVESGDYFIAEEITEAVAKAREKYPKGEFYIAKIGYPATASFKHKTSI